MNIIKNNYPNKIMTDISWMFWDGRCYSLEEFLEKVFIYQENSSSKLWNPKEIELYAPDVYINYSYWDISKEEEQYEMVLLKAQNNEFFTNGELLYKIHNCVENNLAENEEEHVFFGGLIKKSDILKKNDRLLYELILKS